MNGIIALWPYLLINTILAVAAVCLFVSYRKKKREQQIEEQRAIDFKKKEEREVMLRYQAIFNTPLVDIIYYDANGVLTDLNEKARENMGKTRQEILDAHHTINKYLHGADLESFERFHAVECPETPDGAYYEVQVLPIRNAKGKLIGFSRTALDITGSVLFNRHLRESSQKLIGANKSLREYIDNINYALNVGGVRLVAYSPKSHTMSIFEDTNSVKYTLTQAQCLNLLDEKSKQATAQMLDSMDKLMKSDFEVHLRTKFKQKDGSWLYLHIKFQPTYSANGEIKEYFGFIRDESRIKSKEQQLAKESRKALEAENVKNAFLRNMSHEIRTPLASVIGFADLLDQSDSIEDQNMFIEQIKNNSAHLLNLINDILYLSRLDANMIEPKAQTLDVADCFNAFCENGWDKYKKEGVDYVVKNNFHHLLAIFPDEHLSKIIERVATYAARHTDTGSVMASYDYNDNKLVINVTNTGYVLSKEDQSAIFDRFLADKRGGTGLGLVICKRLVDQMKGTISLTSTPEQGTSIWITLPCKVTKIEKKKNL